MAIDILVLCVLGLLCAGAIEIPRLNVRLCNLSSVNSRRGAGHATSSSMRFMSTKTTPASHASENSTATAVARRSSECS